MAMLEVKNLEVYYGVIQAIKGISFEVNEGEVIALIGANGAGKTTTLQTITGMLKPEKGEVIFNGVDISKIPGHKIVPMGMAHVPEGRRVFAQLSVYENLKMGAYTRKDKNEIEESLKMVYKRFPRLEERKNQLAGTLSGGEQQMLAMGRALMSKPKIILMDEAFMGISPIFVEEIFKRLDFGRNNLWASIRIFFYFFVCLIEYGKSPVIVFYIGCDTDVKVEFYPINFHNVSSLGLILLPIKMFLYMYTQQALRRSVSFLHQSQVLLMHHRHHQY